MAKTEKRDCCGSCEHWGGDDSVTDGPCYESTEAPWGEGSNAEWKDHCEKFQRAKNEDEVTACTR